MEGVLRLLTLPMMVLHLPKHCLFCFTPGIVQIPFYLQDTGVELPWRGLAVCILPSFTLWLPALVGRSSENGNEAVTMYHRTNSSLHIVRIKSSSTISLDRPLVGVIHRLLFTLCNDWHSPLRPDLLIQVHMLVGSGDALLQHDSYFNRKPTPTSEQNFLENHPITLLTLSFSYQNNLEIFHILTSDRRESESGKKYPKQASRSCGAFFLSW